MACQTGSSYEPSLFTGVVFNAGLEVSVMSVSHKSPTNLEVTTVHGHYAAYWDVKYKIK